MRRATLLDGCRIDEKARDAFAATRRTLREQQLQAGAAALRLEECRHYLAESCASLGEFGEQNGYSAAETRLLARAAKAVLLHPPLEELLLEGRLTLDAAAGLARVFGDPRVEAAHLREQWISFAGGESARAFGDRVKKRIREVKVQGPVHEVVVHLTDEGLDNLDRARDLLSAKAGKSVSDSETVEILADYFLEWEDPDRVAPGRRRTGEATGNDSRYVASEVRRALRERSNRRCEVPFCDHRIYLEHAHIKAHRDGGGRELEDLTDICTGHYPILDSGWLGVEMVDGKPKFRRPNGIGPPKGPRPPFWRPNPFAEKVATWKRTRPPPGEMA